ncbi:ABC transporter permease [Hymenobacter busanensis]|nr:ABC transporter permease [Hymenobacter busanensis]QHJ09084.1 ABC transporter permease subunit [Hymenobacter busanensis]
MALLLLAFFAPCLPLQWAFGRLDVLRIAAPPSAIHYLGTDPYGRDVLADLLLGARTLLAVGLPAALLTSLIGILLGASAGFWGNQQLRIPSVYFVGVLPGILAVCVFGVSWPVVPAALLGLIASWALHYFRSSQYKIVFPVDSIVLAAMLWLGAIPRIILILVLCAAIDLTPPALVALLALTSWPATARLARAEVQRLRMLPFIEAAKVSGLPPIRIVWHHILPNAWPVLRAAIPLNLSACLTFQTTLAFLGLGLPDGATDWGRMLSLAKLEPTAWWLIVFPCVALATTFLALRVATPTHSRTSA